MSEETYIKQNDMDLFDNPMVRAAAAAMSTEDKERYKEIGEELYGNIDFENSKVKTDTPETMTEAAAYIIEQLKSGIHPSMMEDNEKALMADVFGEKWYEKYGYVEQDLTEIFTLTPTN